MKTNRFAIIGTGAVGGYYGSLLQHAGFDVHFLLHSDFEHVKNSGLRLESPNGNVELPQVHAYHDAQAMPPCDVVVIALKTTANDALAGILPAATHPGSLVLTLQNGLGNEELLAGFVPPEQILGGLCFLCSNKIGPGHIRHLDYGLITVGAYRPDGRPAGSTPEVEAVVRDLRQAGIDARCVEDLLLERWKKLVWNVPFNGLSVLCDTLTDTLVSDPALRRRCRILMQEVAEAATRCARPIDDAFLERMMTNTEKMRPYAPSMKLDAEHGRPMEIESIYGEPLRRAEAAGMTMPETALVYQELKAWETAHSAAPSTGNPS